MKGDEPRSPPMVTIRSVDAHDVPSWLKLRRDLWPEDSEAEHRDEIERFLAARAREPQAVLLALDASGTVGDYRKRLIRVWSIPHSAGRSGGVVIK